MVSGIVIEFVLAVVEGVVDVNVVGGVDLLFVGFVFCVVCEIIVEVGAVCAVVDEVVELLEANVDVGVLVVALDKGAKPV